MTHSTVAVERENAGSLDAAYHVVDITALDSAGTEQYDPGSELGLESPGRFGVDVRAMENDSYRVVYDHINDELSVTNAADNTDVANDTDVGEVMLYVTGV
jgi:hypothetical protein